jgi:hypothetical protein
MYPLILYITNGYQHSEPFKRFGWIALVQSHLLGALISEQQTWLPLLTNPE